jgi:hypothetical protein
MSVNNTFIKVRTQFEGWHRYPDASKIDSRIEFLEHVHRHIFKIEVKISVTHLDRELEFFLVKWALENYLTASQLDYMSCEMIGQQILNSHLIPNYGERYYEIVVSEDGESDGIVEYIPEHFTVCQTSNITHKL